MGKGEQEKGKGKGGKQGRGERAGRVTAAAVSMEGGQSDRRSRGGSANEHRPTQPGQAEPSQTRKAGLNC